MTEQAESVETRNVIVKAEVKRMIKELEHQTASDFTDALNRQVEQMIQAAVRRAGDNGRKQVRSCDL